MQTSQPEPHTWGQLSSTCPCCGGVLDASVGSHPYRCGGLPQPDDITLCLRCASVLRWDAGLELRQVTEAEFKGFPSDLRDEIKRTMRSAAWARQMFDPNA